MNDTTIQGTPEQFEEMETRCEALVAEAMVRRIQGMAHEEAVKCCCNWFRVVRYMSHAALTSSGGGKTSVQPIGGSKQSLAVLNEERRFQEYNERNRRVAALNVFIQQTWKVMPNSAQLDGLRRILSGVPGDKTDMFEETARLLDARRVASVTAVAQPVPSKSDYTASESAAWVAGWWAGQQAATQANQAAGTETPRGPCRARDLKVGMKFTYRWLNLTFEQQVTQLEVTNIDPSVGLITFHNGKTVSWTNWDHALSGYVTKGFVD
jgi:hypothetical protein